MQLVGTKHYLIRVFSDGMGDFVIDEKTLQRTISEVSCEDHVGDFFLDWQGVIHKEFVPESETINAVYYEGVMERLLNRIRRV